MYNGGGRDNNLGRLLLAMPCCFAPYFRLGQEWELRGKVDSAGENVAELKISGWETGECQTPVCCSGSFENIQGKWCY